jgi:hypothetical protein
VQPAEKYVMITREHEHCRLAADKSEPVEASGRDFAHDVQFEGDTQNVPRKKLLETYCFEKNK